MGIENFFKKNIFSKERPEKDSKKIIDKAQKMRQGEETQEARGGEIQRKKKFSKEKPERENKKILDKAQKMRQGEET